MDTTFNLNVLPPTPKRLPFRRMKLCSFNPTIQFPRLICLLHTCTSDKVPPIFPPTVHTLYRLFLRHVHACTRIYYVEVKLQLDATEVFIADLIACSTCFGHHYAHHQELKSIIQWFLPVVFRVVKT